MGPVTLSTLFYENVFRYAIDRHQGLCDSSKRPECAYAEYPN